jgi:hypothetical protein
MFFFVFVTADGAKVLFEKNRQCQYISKSIYHKYSNSTRQKIK